MPAFEVGVDPCGNGREQLVERTGEGIGTERGGDKFADDAGVEGVAGQTEAAVAEQILCGAATFADAGADMEQGEVAGAAAEVADEDEFVVIERGLVGVGGADGLHLEVDGLETSVDEGLLKALQGEGIVVRRVCSDEADGAAYSGVAHRLAKLLFRMEAEVGEDARDEVFDGVAAPEDLGSGESAAGQVGLERLDEAPFVLGVEVMLDCAWAGEAFEMVATCLLELLEVKDGAE